MSTAGRATYQAAKGVAQTSTIQSQHLSGKDQTAHTKLKYRQFGQASKEELAQKNKEAGDLKNKLEQKEINSILSSNKETKWMVKEEEEKVDVKQLLNEQKPIVSFETIQQKYDDADIDFDEVSSDESENEDDDQDGGNRNENHKKNEKDGGFDTSSR
jgi:uncharacterized protein YeaO (DUF488 family)